MFAKKNSKLFLILLFSVLFLVTVISTVTFSRYVRTLSGEFKARVMAVGQVDILLHETKVDMMGQPLTGEDAGVTEEGQRFKLTPGFSYVKDPVVTVVTGSNPCWLFVKVENGIEPYESDENTIHAQMLRNGWTKLAGEENVYYHDIVDAFDEEKRVPVFEEFIIDGEANDVEGWDTITPESTFVDITAYAIQTDGFDDPDKTTEENVAAAWAAFHQEQQSSEATENNTEQG